MIPLYFAPMEGLTDSIYREHILTEIPEWNYIVTDFFRLPTNSTLSIKSFRKHIGESILRNNLLLKKTIIQVLFTERSNIEESLKIISDEGVSMLDLNYGCPSKKVNAHKGGAYLLQNISLLRDLSIKARKAFPGKLSAKIRTGYHNSDNCLEIVKTLKDVGIDVITIHGRTRDEMYQGEADWEMIRQSAKIAPIVGNGDINTTAQIMSLSKEKIFHGLMIGRAAVENPWLAADFISKQQVSHNILSFLETICNRYQENGFKPESLLQRMKALSCYMVKDPNLLRTSELSQFFEQLQESLQNK